MAQTQPRPKHNRQVNGRSGGGNTTTAHTEEAEAQEGAQNYVWQREGTRRIKLHSNRHIAASIDDAVVKTKGGAPDMRFAENRLMFERDPSKRVTGEPDSRFVENRSDILTLHANRGESRPNLLFDEDGKMPEDIAGEDLKPGEEP